MESTNHAKWPDSPWWMVIRIGSGGSTKADAMPTVHFETMDEAREEAKRLASIFPNHPRGFAVVEVKSVFRGFVDTAELNFDRPVVRVNREKESKSYDARLEEFIELRKKICPESYELPADVVCKIGKAMGIRTRMVRFYEASFKKMFPKLNKWNFSVEASK